VGRRANPITDTLALDAARRAWRNLPRTTQNGQDMAARQEMLLASALAGWAFDQSGLGIIHALAGPLTAQFGLHHGLCIGLLLPHGLAYNLPMLGDKRAGLLSALEMPPILSDQAVVDRIKAWLHGLGLPVSLHEVSTVDASRITRADLAALGKAAAQMAMLPNNPRPATAADCTRILEGTL